MIILKLYVSSCIVDFNKVNNARGKGIKLFYVKSDGLTKSKQIL